MYPTTKGGVQKWKLSWNMHTLHTCFCVSCVDLHAQSVLIDKISAVELSRKSSKACVAGWVPTRTRGTSCGPPCLRAKKKAWGEGKGTSCIPITERGEFKKRKKRWEMELAAGGGKGNKFWTPEPTNLLFFQGFLWEILCL